MVKIDLFGVTITVLTILIGFVIYRIYVEYKDPSIRLKRIKERQQAQTIKAEAKLTAHKLVTQKKKTVLSNKFEKEYKLTPKDEKDLISKVMKDKLEELKDKEIVFQEAISYNPVTRNLPLSKRWLNVRYWKDKYIDKKQTDKVLLVHMELNNGFHKEFIIKEEEGSFQYKEKRYILDNDAKYYVIDAKMYAMDFHENFTNPIKRKIPIVDIKKTLEHSNISEVEYASNPSTLERFIVARIAEGIMKGQALDEWMRKVQIMILVIMIVASIHFLLFVYGSGMLENLKIPGVS